MKHQLHTRANINNELWADSMEYFNSQDKAIRWFKTPNLALGLITPEDYLQKPGGAEVVRNIINKLKHGITA